MYKMSCVYIIRHKNSNDCYIGSTKQFDTRIRQHISNIDDEKRNCYNYKLYTFIRENGGWDNFDMVKVCDCEEDERIKMEQHHIDFIKPSLNCKNAFGEDIEKRNEYAREYSRNYRKNNREVVNEKLKIYYKNNKEKFRLYKRENKDIINEKKKQKRYTCECGSELRWVDKARHIRSLKHQRFLASSSC